MRMLISGFSPAKELGTRENFRIQSIDSNTLRVGRENFRIRKKIFAEKNFLILVDMG